MTGGSLPASSSSFTMVISLRSVRRRAPNGKCVREWSGAARDIDVATVQHGGGNVRVMRALPFDELKKVLTGDALKLEYELRCMLLLSTVRAELNALRNGSKCDHGIIDLLYVALYQKHLSARRRRITLLHIVDLLANSTFDALAVYRLISALVRVELDPVHLEKAVGAWQGKAWRAFGSGKWGALTNWMNALGLGPIRSSSLRSDWQTEKARLGAGRPRAPRPVGTRRRRGGRGRT